MFKSSFAIHFSGRGVVTDSKIEQGNFVLQYCGNLISGEEGDYLEENVPSCFRYFFKHSGQYLW